MFREMFLFYSLVALFGNLCSGQVLQFGTCADVEPMKYFQVEKFTGQWYEIERFPNWYEKYGDCAYQRIQYCGRRVEIDHVYVKDSIQYVLHINSTYVPGAEAVFVIQENNIDPVGIPMAVITTDYTNYAIVHGCKYNAELGIRYISAWILSRERTLPEDLLKQARLRLNAIPYANVAYLRTVDQSEAKCNAYWTAHVKAVNINEEEQK